MCDHTRRAERAKQSSGRTVATGLDLFSDDGPVLGEFRVFGGLGDQPYDYTAIKGGWL